VLGSAPKVRAFCKKMAPQNSRAKVCGVEAPQGGGGEHLVLGKNREVRSLHTFCVQNHLPPHQTNATNFVLALIGLSLPH
jgi:hypothetical protein